MKTPRLLTLLCLLTLAFSIQPLAFSQPTPVASASQAEVDAGLLKTKYVSPLTLLHWTGSAALSNAVNLIPGNCIVIITNADGHTWTIAVGNPTTNYIFWYTNTAVANSVYTPYNVTGLTLTGPTTNTAQSVPNWYGGLWGTNPATGNQWLLTNGSITLTGNGVRSSLQSNLLSVATISNQVSSASALTIQAGGTETLVVTNNRVGIGTSAPLAPLNVQAAQSGSTDLLKLTTSNGGLNGPNNLVWTIAGDTYRLGSIGMGWGSSITNSFMSFSTLGAGSTSEKMRIAENGNLGIGVTAPVEKVDVAGAILSTSYMKNTYAGPFAFYAVSGGIYAAGAVDNYFAGNIGVGTTTPASKLNVVGVVKAGETNSTTPAFKSSGTNNMILFCPDGGSWILRVDNSGTLTTVTNTTAL